MRAATQTGLQRATVWGLLHMFMYAIGESQHGATTLGTTDSTLARRTRDCRWSIEVGHPSSYSQHLGTASIGWTLTFTQGRGVLTFETEGTLVQDWEWRTEPTAPPMYDVPEEFCDTLRETLRRYLSHHKVPLGPYARGVFEPS